MLSLFRIKKRKDFLQFGVLRMEFERLNANSFQENKIITKEFDFRGGLLKTIIRPNLLIDGIIEQIQLKHILNVKKKFSIKFNFFRLGKMNFIFI